MQKRVKLPVQEYDFAHAFEFPLHTLLSVLQSRHSNEDIENNFEQFLAPFLQDFVRARDEQEKGLAEAGEEVVYLVIGQLFLKFYSSIFTGGKNAASTAYRVVITCI